MLRRRGMWVLLLQCQCLKRSPPTLFPEPLCAVMHSTGVLALYIRVCLDLCSFSSCQKGHIAFVHVRSRACVSSGRKISDRNQWKESSSPRWMWGSSSKQVYSLERQRRFVSCLEEEERAATASLPRSGPQHLSGKGYLLGTAVWK